jgi:molybdopterin molybdotransferase
VIRYAEALAHVREAGARHATGLERVPLLAAVRRVLADDVRASEPNPRFDNSGMDGFAVRAADLAGASPDRPVTLPVRGSFAAGDDAAALPLAERGTCAEIMTGAPIPPGLDAVVRVEDAVVERDAWGSAARATFRAPAVPGQDVRPAGEDFREGDVIAAAGTELLPRDVLGLATVGAGEVAVRRRPRVAVISTGKEVQPFTAATLAPGQLRNSTGPFLRTALPLLGAETISATTIGDDPPALRAAIEAAARDGADLVVSTGAVSAGKHDFVEDVLGALGARLVFHKVAVRPGKPVLLAELPGGPAVLGLPGNPVAAVVSTRFLVAPFLRAALGLAPERPVRATLAAEAHKPEGLRCFFKARVTAGPRGLEAVALEGQGSAIVSSLLGANGWLVLPEEGRRVPAGVEVDVVSLLEPELLTSRGIE